MIVLAVDPGKVTGFALWADGDLVLAEQIPHMKFLRWADETISVYRPWDLEVVAERFQIGVATMSRSKDAHWAMKQVGMLEYWSNVAGVPFTTQAPATAKTFATDGKLRAVGWYRPTPGGHVNDALRHLLVYLVDRKLIDLQTLVLPDT